MKYFIFDFNRDDGLIDGLLDSAAVAHKIPKKTKEWFYWKFRDNPYGESVLSCVQVGGRVIGCVAYGMQLFKYYNKEYAGALSFETFVDPDYQGKGIFTQLIKKAETELKKRRVQLLLNFPNVKSMPGFIKDGWKSINVSETWLKVLNYKNPIGLIKNIRKEFIPLSHEYQDRQEDLLCVDDLNAFYASVNADYLRWRFFSYPHSAYVVLRNSVCQAVARVGKRGELFEVQVLYLNIHNQKEYNHNLFMRELRTRCNCDIVTMPVSKNNKYKKYFYLSGFIRVPNRTNVCFKVLDKDAVLNFEEIALYGINYHTY